MGAVSVSHDCPALEERTRLVNTPSDTAVCDVCKLGKHVLRRNRIDTPVYKKLIIDQYIYHTSIILFHKAITKSNKSIMNIVDKISSRQCLLEVFTSSLKLYQSRKVKAKKK